MAFALCRYAGLRCASEVSGLKWADVNWQKMRFTVHAPKTEHHADAGIRVVPIFAELAPTPCESKEPQSLGVAGLEPATSSL